MLISLEHTVTKEETDNSNRVKHFVYFAYLECIRQEFLRMHSSSDESLLKTYGLGLIVTSTSAIYRSPIHQYDEITVASDLNIQGLRFKVNHEIHRHVSYRKTGLVFTAEETYALAPIDGRKPVQVPTLLFKSALRRLKV